MSENSDEESVRILADIVKRGHASQGDTVSQRLSPRKNQIKVLKAWL